MITLPCCEQFRPKLQYSENIFDYVQCSKYSIICSCKQVSNLPPETMSWKCTNVRCHKCIQIKSKIKSSLYSPYYAEACNELWGPYPRLSAWATQVRRNVATVASRWRHCTDLTGPGIEPQTFRTDSACLATELFEYCAL